MQVSTHNPWLSHKTKKGKFVCHEYSTTISLYGNKFALLGSTALQWVAEGG